MANYLARVAASGAASRINGRPAVVAPPILPGRGVSSESELPRSGALINRAGPFADAPVSGASTDSTAPDTHPQSAQTPSPAIDPAVSPQPQRFPTPGLQSTHSNLIRAPRPLAKPDEANAITPKAFPLTPSPEAVIHAPRSFASYMPRLFTSTQTAGDEVGAQRQEPVFTPSSFANIDMPAPKNAEGALEPSAQQIAQPASKAMGIRPDAPNLPAANAVFDLPTNGVTARREPKITIGQIDVQVINTPAPVPVPTAPSNAADSKGFQSAELDRFKWRLR